MGKEGEPSLRSAAPAVGMAFAALLAARADAVEAPNPHQSVMDAYENAMMVTIGAEEPADDPPAAVEAEPDPPEPVSLEMLESEFSASAADLDEKLNSLGLLIFYYGGEVDGSEAGYRERYESFRVALESQLRGDRYAYWLNGEGRRRIQSGITSGQIEGGWPEVEAILGAHALKVCTMNHYFHSGRYPEPKDR